MILLELAVTRRNPPQHLFPVALKEWVLSAQEDVREAAEAPHIHRLARRTGQQSHMAKNVRPGAKGA